MSWSRHTHLALLVLLAATTITAPPTRKDARTSRSIWNRSSRRSSLSRPVRKWPLARAAKRPCQRTGRRRSTIRRQSVHPARARTSRFRPPFANPVAWMSEAKSGIERMAWPACRRAHARSTLLHRRVINTTSALYRPGAAPRSSDAPRGIRVAIAPYAWRLSCRDRWGGAGLPSARACRVAGRPRRRWQ